MISDRLLIDPVYWLVPWLIQSLAYFMVLGKMGLKKWKAIIPFYAEQQMSTKLFRRMRTFWRPFFIAMVFMAGAYYLGPDEGMGYVYVLVAQIVYGLFLIRLYCRLAKSFGKGVPFTIGLILIPTLFLFILGLGKSEYHPLQFKEEKNYGAFINGLRRVTVAVFTVAEMIVIVLGVGFLTVRTYPPRTLVESLNKSTHEQTKDIVSDGKALARKDTMGDAYAGLADMPVSRDKFFPDHSQDKSVVVMEYIIGADLEDRAGMASVNIDMMKDATKQGDALTFVLEAGGSKRWFTGGIADNSYGRYTVKGGKVEQVMDLEGLSSMEEPANLEDFIKWTTENYPADRYMLVLWDHGGGVPYGYGVDQLQHREDADGFEGLRVSDVVNAIEGAGVKFDIIGFDACLMQDIEIAQAIEPYADYYLASEESEPGYGWFYTSAFAALAKEPGMSSEDFGKNIISSFDQFYTTVNDNEPAPGYTLSLVDLTRIKPAYDKLKEVFEKADGALRDDPKDFAEIGLAASNAYSFTDGIQIDAVDFMNKLDDTDVDNSICPQEEKDDAADAMKACVVYRNKNSAEGINGVSVALPYKMIDVYDDTQAELSKLSLDGQRSFFNDIFSVIAAQKKEEYDKQEPSKYRIVNIMRELAYVDYTQQDWYEKGFEDYDSTTTLVDIPLRDTGEGYVVELPDKTWDIISDCVTAVYQKADDGTYRYLGYDHTGGLDENGHPMVDMDDRWIHINGRLVCYEDKGQMETEDGTVFKGDVKARLNGTEDIVIHIEWNAVSDE
ncbi:MAG: hypothetical protein IJ227_04970, partial [Mogibacterium sp.]|nr:hypothetical protein [Mogibacterium sp.]